MHTVELRFPCAESADRSKIADPRISVSKNSLSNPKKAFSKSDTHRAVRGEVSSPQERFACESPNNVRYIGSCSLRPGATFPDPDARTGRGVFIKQMHQAGSTDRQGEKERKNMHMCVCVCVCACAKKREWLLMVWIAYRIYRSLALARLSMSLYRGHKSSASPTPL